MATALGGVWSLLKGVVRRFVRHRRGYYRDALSRRLEPAELRAVLEELGIRQGTTLMVHSSLSALGYIVGGERAVLNVLCEAVGPDGTIVMPALPFAGSMDAYVAGRPVFDVRDTPSAAGRLTEAFRTMPGVIRSVHPTHSACAWGATAESLTEGHWRSPTPCGPASPWGRLAEVGCYALRLGTGALTMAHHAQEAVDFPNLFLPDPVPLTCVDSANQTRVVESYVYRPRIPQIVYLGRDVGDQVLSVRFRDYPLLFSGDRQALYEADPTRRLALEQLLRLRKRFAADGNWRVNVLHGCVFELFPLRPWLDCFVTTQTRLLAELRDLYELERLTRLLADGSYPP